jgi:hypothetical protein
VAKSVAKKGLILLIRIGIHLTFFEKRQSECVSVTTIGSSPLGNGEDIYLRRGDPESYRCKITWAHIELVRGYVEDGQPAILARLLHPPQVVRVSTLTS